MPKDDYKIKLVKGLKELYGISVDESALDSVVSPAEFRQFINTYSPDDFSVGDYNCPDFKNFFKNVTDGNFRITLHGHSDFSDGRMTPVQFIDQAAKYGDKLAKKWSNDVLPPFLIALTDHDEICGCSEILKIISQKPNKFKNLKFVVGSEIGSAIGDNYFDLTALAFNPFDTELNNFITSLKDKRTITVNELIAKVNALDNSNYTIDDLKKIGFKGKKTLQNRSGLIYVEDSKNILRQFYREKYGPDNEFESQIESIYKENNYMNMDIPSAEEVIKIVKNAGGFLSWTHPVRSFSKIDDLNWHEDFLINLVKLGVEGVEANHQYTYGQYSKIKNISGKNELYRRIAKKHDLFLSGGTDSHEENIFAHHQPIEQELLNNFLN